MTLAKIGYGSVFQTFNGTEWVSVAEAAAMNLPPLTRDVVDAGHESAPDEWRQVITGLKNAGEIGVELNFTAAEYQARFADLSNASIARRILLPDNSVYPFNAYLVGLETGVAVADKITAGAKFRVVGEPGPLTIGLPFGDGEPPAFYANFENQFYWHGNSHFDNWADFLASLEGAYFYRPANGLVRNTSGAYELVANATPRFDHDDSGNPIGLLMEDARIQWHVNGLHMSLTPAGDNVNTTPNLDHVAPYSPAYVTKSTRGTTGDTNVGIVQPYAGITPLTNTTLCVSMYVWLPASTTFTDANGFSISQENPAAPWAAATGLVAKPDLSKRDQWQRIWGILSSSLTGTGLPTFVFRLSATTGGVVYFTMFQIEHGAFPSTFMPSDGFYYSRFGDDFVVPSSAVSGFKTTEGTLLTYNGLPYTPAGTDGFRTVFSLNNPTDRAVIFKMPTVGGEGHVAIGRDSVTQYSAVSSGGFWLASTPKIKNVLSWKTTANAYINGVPFPNSGIAVLPPIAANEFHVGTSGFMLFKEIAYWPKHISNAELIRLTTP